jgi:hypothetical protein
VVGEEEGQARSEDLVKKEEVLCGAGKWWWIAYKHHGTVHGVSLFFFFTLEKYTLRAGIGRSKERHWRRIRGPFFYVFIFI